METNTLKHKSKNLRITELSTTPLGPELHTLENGTVFKLKPTGPILYMKTSRRDGDMISSVQLNGKSAGMIQYQSHGHNVAIVVGSFKDD